MIPTKRLCNDTTYYATILCRHTNRSLLAIHQPHLEMALPPTNTYTPIRNALALPRRRQKILSGSNLPVSLSNVGLKLKKQVTNACCPGKLIVTPGKLIITPITHMVFVRRDCHWTPIDVLFWTTWAHFWSNSYTCFHRFEQCRNNGFRISKPTPPKPKIYVPITLTLSNPMRYPRCLRQVSPPFQLPWHFPCYLLLGTLFWVKTKPHCTFHPPPDWASHYPHRVWRPMYEAWDYSPPASRYQWLTTLPKTHTT